ncbi:MAG: hypothetical protein ABIH08_04795 [Candidatus Omnitrophota bacterium]
MNKKNRSVPFFVLLFLLVGSFFVYGVTDTYIEDFDGRQDDATVEGVDSWSVDQGEDSDAVVQDSTTYSGDGKALELIGAETTANVSRSDSYGSVSPCWVEFIVKPAVGAQARSFPSGKIAAIYFSHTGQIYASDGTAWTDTGEEFSADDWYRVLLKLNFTTHLYDIYIEPAAVPEVEFIADKEGLNFIDDSISSLNQIGFEGVYSLTRADDSFVDDLIVYFVDRLKITTAAQSLAQDKASSPITVQLQSSYSEPQTAWKNITLELQSSSGKGEFSLSSSDWNSVSQATISENAQSATFYYKDSTVGKPIITVNEYPDKGWEDTSQQIEIASKAAYFDISAVTPQTAGEYFSTVITAKNNEGDVDETYNGEVEIFANYVSPYSGVMRITPNSAFGFKKGVLRLELMYPDCGIIEIAARDTQESSKVGYSGEILFIPASFTVFAQSPQVVSRLFNLSVSALNTLGAIAPNYQSPTALSTVFISPDSGLNAEGITPVGIDSGEFQNGIAEADIKYDGWGTIQIEAYNEAYPDRKGTSEIISFIPNGVLVEVEPPSSEREFFYTGETIEIFISLIDTEGNPISNYQGKIDISFTAGLGLPNEYQFTAADQGKKELLTTVSSAGIYTAKARDEQSSLEAESPEIEVQQAILQVISTFSPIGTTEVVIQLIDIEGNIITSEDELTLQVDLEEEFDDSSASSTAVNRPVTFKKGIAKILVSNTQAEIITVSPKGQYDFKIKKGTITFGRIAKSGIGTLMWREVKD